MLVKAIVEVLWSLKEQGPKLGSFRGATAAPNLISMVRSINTNYP